MADRSKAHEITDGLIINPEQGIEGSFITSGPYSPVGAAQLSGLIAGDLYIQKSAIPIIWQRFGAGINDWRQLSAEDIPALDQNLIPQTVQYMLDQTAGGGGSGVSQTAIFGSGGNTAQNSYLPNEGVPSNVVGVPIGLTNAKIRSFFLGNTNVRTGDVYVQERFPVGAGTWTTIYTAQLNVDDYLKVGNLDVPITTDAEIAVFTTVSLKNVKVVLNINGDSTV